MDQHTHPAVHIDFQNADPQGRVRLNTVGALADIERLGITLRGGSQLLLADAELSTLGKVAWSEDEQLWVAEVDWNDVVESFVGVSAQGSPLDVRD